jgi:hypothetical protein
VRFQLHVSRIVGGNVSLKCTGTLLILSNREKFSSDTETVVGSLLSLAAYFSWRYILVGSIFWVCRWIVVSGKSEFVGSSVLSVISWLLLCLPIYFPPLNTTTSSCLRIQALKQYQSSDNTYESSLQQRQQLWQQQGQATAGADSNQPKGGRNGGWGSGNGGSRGRGEDSSRGGGGNVGTDSFGNNGVGSSSGKQQSQESGRMAVMAAVMAAAITAATAAAVTMGTAAAMSVATAAAETKAAVVAATAVSTAAEVAADVVAMVAETLSWQQLRQPAAVALW